VPFHLRKTAYLAWIETEMPIPAGDHVGDMFGDNAIIVTRRQTAAPAQGAK
jgi:hypothetical protein